MIRTALLASAVALMALGSANAQDRTEVGLLECVVEANVGQFLSSSREVGCTFLPADESRAPEAYFGVINRYGLDIGVTDAAIMQWLVLAPTTDRRWRLPLALGARLRNGDEVLTGVDSRVYIRLADSSLVKLGGNATFTLSGMTQEEGVFRAALQVVEGAVLEGRVTMRGEAQPAPAS